MGLAMSCGETSPGTNIQAVAGSEAVQEIRNGDLAVGRQYSGIGAILATTTHGLCSGSMISKSVAITAAQCIRDLSPDPLFTFSILGEPGRGGEAPTSNRLAVATVLRSHPGFDTVDGLNLAYDVALVRLEKAETRKWRDVRRYEVNTVEMPTSVHATGVGFGESSFRPGTRTSGDFLVTQYIAGEGPIGVEIPHAFLEVQPGNVKNQMICPGDSGGPLLYKEKISGVASFRFVATCPEDGPGYQVSTARLTPWITDTLNDLDPPGACEAEDDAEFTTAEGGCKDMASGAVWSAPGTKGLSQADAVAYCDALVEAGRDDWRLATIEELALLDAHLSPATTDDDDGDDDDGQARPASIRHLGPLAQTWSSTSWNGEHGHVRGAAFNFSSHRKLARPAASRDRALCVRNSTPPPPAGHHEGLEDAED
jgi:hypothetical protein